ncbi:MAG: DUF192 domain-containing protein [Deltaproteobacteria bacterium]|nr:DUF192 domain-containing protein [Deltaproteobacteria bacterium]
MTGSQMVTLVLDDRPLRLMVATTWSARRRGLAYRAYADWSGYDGLLLHFPFRWYWPVWMVGMQFPIQLYWCVGSRVIATSRPLDPGHPWALHWPPQAVDRIIELMRPPDAVDGAASGWSAPSRLRPAPKTAR